MFHAASVSSLDEGHSCFCGDDVGKLPLPRRLADTTAATRAWGTSGTALSSPRKEPNAADPNNSGFPKISELKNLGILGISVSVNPCGAIFMKLAQCALAA